MFRQHVYERLLWLVKLCPAFIVLSLRYKSFSIRLEFLKRQHKSRGRHISWSIRIRIRFVDIMGAGYMFCGMTQLLPTVLDLAITMSSSWFFVCHCLNNSNGEVPWDLVLGSIGAHIKLRINLILCHIVDTTYNSLGDVHHPYPAVQPLSLALHRMSPLQAQAATKQIFIVQKSTL